MASCGDEVVKLLAKRWGLNVSPPVPEVDALIQKEVVEQMDKYKAEFVPDLPASVPDLPASVPAKKK